MVKSYFTKLANDLKNIVSFKAGENIFEEGQPGDAMYVVVTGMVRIKVGGKVTTTISDGGIFGEMAILENIERSATAVAFSDCQIAKLDQRRFLFMVQETPMFALEVMKVMANRLREMNLRR